MPTTFANSIDSNPIYAERAVCDAAGRDIAQTYSTGPESFSQDQLAYLKQALGVDETILYKDSTGIVASGETAVLSEAAYNFEKLAFYSEPIYGGALARNEFETSNNVYRFNTGSLDGSTLYIAQYVITTSGQTLTITRSLGLAINYVGKTIGTVPLSTTGTFKAPIRKIVGVHRLAGGN